MLTGIVPADHIQLAKITSIPQEPSYPRARRMPDHAPFKSEPESLAAGLNLSCAAISKRIQALSMTRDERTTCSPTALWLQYKGVEGPAGKVETLVDRHELRARTAVRGSRLDGEREALAARLADEGRYVCEASLEACEFGEAFSGERSAVSAIGCGAKKEVDGELLPRRKPVESGTGESPVRVGAVLA